MDIVKLLLIFASILVLLRYKKPLYISIFLNKCVNTITYLRNKWKQVLTSTTYNIARLGAGYLYLTWNLPDYTVGKSYVSFFTSHT